MSSKPSTETLMELLNAMYANIVQFAREDMLKEAEQNFYSTRDYALGDTISCNAEQALENCEQLRGYFPPGSPASVFRSIDAVKGEILRLEKSGRPWFAGKLWILVILAAVGYIVYWVLSQPNY
jgi:hypothetical protein